VGGEERGGAPQEAGAGGAFWSGRTSA
jgi:hypothetical protein